VLLAQGYGLADRDTGEPNTPQTRFRICSVTKQFTAMAILLLQAQGKLNVRDRVCDYISDCPTAWMGISLHHLLTHTSGIPDLTDLPDYERTKGDPTTPLELVSRVKDRPLEFAPGERWSYSNSGYALLGYLIEVISGRSYAEFVEENIFVPLGMSDSGYDHNLAVLARGYTGEGEGWRDGDYVDASVPYAAGALYSTVEDLYRWDQALYGQDLVSQDLLDTMFTPFVPSPIGEFGYGWIISTERGRQLVRHGGGGDGFTSLIARYPDDRVTIILLSNRDTTDMGSILSSISREVFD
jgi:CubicO group peptidase (beta-lactamase class C family)